MFWEIIAGGMGAVNCRGIILREVPGVTLSNPDPDVICRGIPLRKPPAVKPGSPNPAVPHGEEPLPQPKACHQQSPVRRDLPTIQLS